MLKVPYRFKLHALRSTPLLGSALVSLPASAAPNADQTADLGLLGNLSHDAVKGLALVGRQLAQPAPDTYKLALLGGALVLAYFIMGPGREWLLTRLSAFLRERHQRSALVVFGRALGAVLVTLLSFSIGGALALNAVTRCLNLLPELKTLATILFAGCVISGLGLGIGRALRSADAKELRPVQLPSGLGQTIAFYPFAAGIMLGAASLIDQASRILHASDASWGVAQGALALAQLALIGRFLILAGRARERVVNTAAQDDGPSLPAIFGLTAIVWAVLMVAFASVLFGHTRFAMTLLQEVLWAALVLTTAWLITRFLDAVVAHFLGEDKRATRFATGVIGVQKTRIDQGALLGSAIVSVVIWLIAILLAVAPLQGGGDNVVEQVRPSPMIASLQAIHLSPNTIFTALAVLIGGIVATRMVRSWLERRFLPSTNLDIGARTSITTGLSYVGIIVALLATSGTLGLQLEKITLIASALTVGIGFGLQAIIQNFVSGVIMLFERPVKIGDRIAVSGSEGKIRRMRVRATEVVADDGSVAIIPNSSFISSTVVNKSAVAAPTQIALTVTVTGAQSAKAAQTLLFDHFSNPNFAGSEPSIHLAKFGTAECVFDVVLRPSAGSAPDLMRSDVLMDLSGLHIEGIDIAAV